LPLDVCSAAKASLFNPSKVPVRPVPPTQSERYVVSLLAD
jgi:hypothetical protein